MKLVGKVALVTGARGGIGRALSLALAEVGADVALADLVITPEDEIVREVEALGHRALAVAADVSKRDSVQAMVSTIEAELGPIDILINNAGIIRPAMLHKMTEEQWDQVIDVHLKGTFLCLQAVAPSMMERQTGRIINVTSAAGLVGTIGQINYSAAKGGIDAMTKSAARELARYGVTVNAICPFAETPMTSKIATDPKLKPKYLERVPMGRFGQPEEIAPAALFLASPEASYITGQTLCIDGGLVMR
ncbi:beta-ketoacyl-ACP reductase [Heliophilum fasciatum]|uniref:3-oxoacyl-[acyl-carrier protein] reductase n=1 Tax=Heliophilum fasciatum TaxID=35700 RepID=A0A4R2RVN4_9FIRM|nr:beta-ketoacyl-ACP reductase [Heliophilum fasciatum]MCW2278168.1 3-oxoacyl-[acyl-carrier protein] reductase [Heliophilum fasciatum]TCP64011.1 3-oxoacyl-[acyl-carrier protein] reductase [Heliophilum fasciatum]